MRRDDMSFVKSDRAARHARRAHGLRGPNKRAPSSSDGCETCDVARALQLQLWIGDTQSPRGVYLALDKGRRRTLITAAVQTVCDPP